MISLSPNLVISVFFVIAYETLISATLYELVIFDVARHNFIPTWHVGTRGNLVISVFFVIAYETLISATLYELVIFDVARHNFIPTWHVGTRGSFNA